MKFPNADCVWKLKAKRQVLGLTEIEHEDLKSAVEFDHQETGTVSENKEEIGLEENNEKAKVESEKDEDSKVKDTIPKITRKMEPVEKVCRDCFILLYMLQEECAVMELKLILPW